MDQGNHFAKDLILFGTRKHRYIDTFRYYYIYYITISIQTMDDRNAIVYPPSKTRLASASLGGGGGRECLVNSVILLVHRNDFVAPN